MRSHSRLQDQKQAFGSANSTTASLQRLYKIYNTDAFEWLKDHPMNSIYAVVTDPPYGLVEYSEKELIKLKNGRGGIWRLPPSFDGNKRMPLPRFTVLSESDQKSLRDFSYRLASLLKCVLVPGGHVFIATNPLISHLVYESFIRSGFEKRADIIRTVYTLRGGDRPKNAHDEFSDVTVMPKSCWEPWGLFRKPCEGRVQDNLRKWKTGGLRRISPSEPFKDLIKSSPARKQEREIAPHPSLKPQNFLRQIVRASLP
ncbi:MAG: site-specific DNA-methyltransferase, partial [Pyrinomonadaceae bacterium]